MKFPEINISIEKALELNFFKEIDYYAVNNFNLPIELMMENAGLQLANLISRASKTSQSIKIGIGNGNNGGGGLVAARRLLAWGYTVHLDLVTDITKTLPLKQLNRALAFGAQTVSTSKYDVWVDAYLGFSQRLPLSGNLLRRIEDANNDDALKISLDIPTGFDGYLSSIYFHCDKVITLAASKKILYTLPGSTEIFIADLGIPAAVYQKFNVEPLPFQTSNILKLTR